MLCPRCGKAICDCLLEDPAFLARVVGKQLRLLGSEAPGLAAQKSEVGSEVAVGDSQGGDADICPSDKGGASTPPWLFDYCNRMAVEACGEPMTLDVCAAPWNHKCERYFTEEQDGRKQPWDAKAVWLNCPYTVRLIDAFVKKAIAEKDERGTTTVALLPDWGGYDYMDLCEKQGRIHRIKGPVVFAREDGSTFPMNCGFRSTAVKIVVFGPNVKPGFGKPITRNGDSICSEPCLPLGRAETDEPQESAKEFALRSDDEEEEGGPIMIKHRGRTIVANTPKEATRAVEAITHLPASCNGKTIDITTAERRARRNLRRKKVEGQVIPPMNDDDIRIYHCRFQDLPKVAGIEPENVPFMFADIPYDGRFLPQVSELAQVASELLVPGGAMAIQTGTYYFDETTRRLGEYLTPVTFGITIWDGDANILHPIQCASQFKPVWIYSKGVWRSNHRWGDVCRVGKKEKDLHDMQQPLEDAEHWLLALTNPGELVVECCGGAFSVAIACHLHHRRYIGCDCDEDAVITGQQRLEKYRTAY